MKTGGRFLLRQQQNETKRNETKRVARFSVRFVEGKDGSCPSIQLNVSPAEIHARKGNSAPGKGNYSHNEAQFPAERSREHRPLSANSNSSGLAGGVNSYLVRRSGTSSDCTCSFKRLSVSTPCLSIPPCVSQKAEARTTLIPRSLSRT